MYHSFVIIIIIMVIVVFLAVILYGLVGGWVGADALFMLRGDTE